MLIRDFNQVTSTDEKISKIRAIPGASDFKNVTDQCGLLDIKPIGNWFTWCNGRKGPNCVWERLDRVLISENWLNLFNDFNVECLPLLASDHSPLIASTINPMPYRHRPKRFEAMWSSHPDCKKVIHAAWDSNFQGSLAFVVAKKINHTLSSLLS